MIKYSKNKHRYDINKIHEKYTRKCLKKAYRNGFNKVSELKKEYYNQLCNIVQNYDARVILISYMEYVISRYNYLFFTEHREREVLVGLLQTHGVAHKVTNLINLAKALPPKKTVKRLFELLSMYNALMSVNDEIIQSLESKKHFYEHYKSPEYLTRFKTNYVRNLGSGNQHVNYIKEILDIYDKNKGTNLNKIVITFSKLYEFACLPDTRNLDHKDGIQWFKYNMKKLFGIEVNKYFSPILSMFLFRNSWIQAMGLLCLTSVYIENEIEALVGHENTQYIRKMSYELSKSNAEDLWVGNPIKTNPFIKIEDKYIYYVQGIHLTFLEEAILNSFSSKEKEYYYKVKTKMYLEKKIYGLLVKKYNEANIYQGLEYQIGNVEYDNDVLFLYNETALIIEVKGTGLTEKGNRGNSKRLETQIGKIISEASKQATRLEKIIQKNKKNNFFTKNKSKINIDFSCIKNVIKMSVSFEWLIFFSLSMHLLRDKHSISNEHIHMALAEFEDMIDIFDNEYQLLYYLYKRTLLESYETPLKGDECDLMYYFINNAFDLPVNKLISSFDVTGEFNKQEQPSYFTLKHCLFPDNELIKKERAKRKKPSIHRIEFIERIINFLIKTKRSKSLKLLGYFYCMPEKYQNDLRKRVNNKVSKEDEIVVKSRQIDYFSPIEHVVLYKGLKGPYNQFISRLKRRLEINEFGSVVLVYNLDSGAPVLKDIQYIMK